MQLKIQLCYSVKRTHPNAIRVRDDLHSKQAQRAHQGQRHTDSNTQARSAADANAVAPVVNQLEVRRAKAKLKL